MDQQEFVNQIKKDLTTGLLMDVAVSTSICAFQNRKDLDVNQLRKVAALSAGKSLAKNITADVANYAFLSTCKDPNYYQRLLASTASSLLSKVAVQAIVCQIEKTKLDPKQLAKDLAVDAVLSVVIFGISNFNETKALFVKEPVAPQDVH